MSHIYQSPLRVYLCLGLLAAIGIFAGLNLPISLFPNSSKPTVLVKLPYASLSSEEFAKTYGANIESNLKALSDPKIKIQNLETEYGSDAARFKIFFSWGVDQVLATKEVQATMNGLSAQFPNEIRDGLRVWSWTENGGFLAISFFSKTRSLDDLYSLLEPTLTPKISVVRDASEAALFNPDRKEILVELRPEAMAAFQVLPKDIASAIQNAMSSRNGGSLTVNTNHLIIKLPRQALALHDFESIPLVGRAGVSLKLSDVASFELRTSQDSSRSFKTSGAPSLILFANPAPNGNIKKMAEDILKIVQETEPLWPDDVEYRILVDPSEFIRSSINNVLHEVLLAAALAVLILFLFVGNLRNVVTAAIEIPLSIVLAFILMHLSGININLISLGGLALSAGMNVDASVVVMENIFRHFDLHKGILSSQQRLKIVSQAVAEVRLPIIASTIASVVVFLPLALTSNFSYAILGDLAKTVVFSHSFSAVVALILVPTIRLQLMRIEKKPASAPPIDPIMKWVEKTYIGYLEKFLDSRSLRRNAYVALLVIMVSLVTFLLPTLPKEIIGTPDTDWMFIGIHTEGHTQMKQMDELSGRIESEFMKSYADKFSYTFLQIQNPNNSHILARLIDKSNTEKMMTNLQEYFKNTPFVRYHIMPWNPSELPIPDPPQFQLSVLGGTPNQRVQVAEQLGNLLQDNKLFPRVWQKPNPVTSDTILLQPYSDQWSNLSLRGANLTMADLADLSRVATDGRQVGRWTMDNKTYNIIMRYPTNIIKTPEDLASMPLGVLDKIIPLKALADIKLIREEPTRFRVNQQEVAELYGKLDKADERKGPTIAAQAASLVNDWLTKNPELIQGTSVQIDDAQHELNDALRQLVFAIGLSIVLVFLTMVLQLGDIVSSLLVMVAIPLGFIGVMISLFIFQSTLSLNSALGVILLNGIAVANSIILVDFLNRLVKEGRPVREAALEAARSRLRPILMTSLTTAIGMLPIAMGLGDGGKILQPLGIAISGGLWFSMSLTLVIVPALQVSYLNWKQDRKGHVASITGPQPMEPAT